MVAVIVDMVANVAMVALGLGKVTKRCRERDLKRGETFASVQSMILHEVALVTYEQSVELEQFDV